MAVDKLAETYEQLKIEQGEKQKLAKKATKYQEKLELSIDLVNNLLEQKKELQQELKKG